MAQWVPTGGPLAGEIASMATLGSDVFVGPFDPSGLYRSTDSGATWKVVNVNGFPMLTALDGRLFSNNAYSIDSGITWKPFIDTADSLIPGPTAIVGVGKDLVFISAGTFPNAYTSTDSGAHWRVGAESPINVSCIAQSEGNIYVGTLGGVFKSSDTGLTWNAVNTGLNGYKVTLLTASGSIIFAAVGDRICSSTNQGANWVAAPAPPKGQPLSMAILSGSNPSLVVGCYSGVSILSADHQTWIDGGLSGSYVQQVTTLGARIIAGDPDGVFISTDSGASWRIAGIPNGYAVPMIMQGDNLVAGVSGVNGDGQTEVFHHDSNWTISKFDSASFGVQSLTSVGGILLEGNNQHLIERSIDSGAHWAPLNPNTDGIGFQLIYSFAHSNGKAFAGSSYDQIYSSTDTGLTWTICDTTLRSNNSGEAVVSLAASGDTILAGTHGSGIFRSTDQGASWERINNGLLDTNIAAVAIHGSTFIAATFYAGVAISTDGGEHWKRPSNNSFSVYQFAISGPYIFAGNGTGVFLSTTEGLTWDTITANLPATGATYIAANDSTIYAGTISAGVWKRSISNMFTASVPAAQDQSTNVLSVYPNPASSSVTVTFSAEASGPGTVTIFNMLGEGVAKVFDGNLSAGNHSFEWNAAAVPSGIYECVVRANGQTYSIPIIHE